MTVSSLSARDEALLRHVLAVGGPTSPGTLEQVLQVSRPTINRALRDLVAAGFLDKQGGWPLNSLLGLRCSPNCTGGLHFILPWFHNQNKPYKLPE